MDREKRVCYYPVFTMTEAVQVEEAAQRYGTNVEDYLRHILGMDKLPARALARVGRPPLSLEVRQKREAEQAELRRLRLFVSSTRRGQQRLRQALTPALEGKLRAAQQLLAEYDARRASVVGRWEALAREHVGRVVSERGRRPEGSDSHAPR